MIEFKIKHDDIGRLIDKLKRLSIRESGNILKKSFLDAALLVERKLKGNISGSSKGSSESILKVRSGRLRSSISSIVKSGENSLQAIIGSGVKQGNRVSYANIHETGGTITPKKARWLTIPLQAAKTPSGVARFSARDVKEGRTKYTKSFINKGIIFGIVGKSSAKNIIPLFVLKSSVTIPATHYMQRTLNDVKQDVVAIISKRINEAINK